MNLRGLDETARTSRGRGLLVALVLTLGGCASSPAADWRESMNVLWMDEHVFQVRGRPLPVGRPPLLLAALAGKDGSDAYWQGVERGRSTPEAMQKVSDLALYRCIEVAQEHGCAFLEILETGGQGSVTTPVSTERSETTGTVEIEEPRNSWSEPTARVKSSTETTPAATRSYEAPPWTFVVRCSVERPDGGNVVNCAILGQSIRQRYGTANAPVTAAKAVGANSTEAGTPASDE